MEFEKIDAVSLTDNIYKSLLTKILSGDWKPGKWFPAERDIADQMSVSRSSLHQAILQLERDGFVYILPRKGTQVADYRKEPTPQSLSAIMRYGSEEMDEPLFRELVDVRRWMEIECAQRACTNINDSTAKEMRAIAERLAEENAAVPERIFRYHYLLAQASGNSIFPMMFRIFEPLMLLLISRHFSLREADLQEAAAMHKELLDHIEAKDKDAAAECVDRLLAQGVNVLAQKYKQGE